MISREDLKDILEENTPFEKMVDALFKFFKSSEEIVKFPDANGLVPVSRMIKTGPTNVPKTIDHSVDPEHKKRLDHLSNLHTVKNAKYGKSFDRGLDKHGVISWIVRDEDKENRMLELFDQCIKKDPESGEWFFDDISLDGNDESLSDTILDRANYLIMLDMWIKQLPAKRYNKVYVDNKVFDKLEEWDTYDKDNG